MRMVVFISTHAVDSGNAKMLIFIIVLYPQWFYWILCGNLNKIVNNVSTHNLLTFTFPSL